MEERSQNVTTQDESPGIGNNPNTFRQKIGSALVPVLQALYSNVRPWRTFCILEKPSTLAKAQTSARDNFLYFRMNYVALMAASVVFGIMLQPRSFIGLGVVIVMWSFSLAREQDPSFKIVIADKVLTNTQRYALLGTASVAIMYFTSGLLFFNMMCVSLVLSACHGLLHPGASAVGGYDTLGFEDI